MKDYIEDRVKRIAEYVLLSKATVRQAAKAFGTSKSTVHKDMTERLSIISPSTAKQVAKILKKNKEERHIRGGNATRMKYRKQ
ncbi:MAG: sporulation transcriptional regulator SpoIIID [Christensenellales bacterium]|jgi:putative DeoR family transcriptional regulator (stage III sporulation protein D)